MKIYFRKISRALAHEEGRDLLSRAVMSVYGIEISEKDIGKGEKGKPFFPSYPHIHFNISHSGEYVVCAVADEEVGVDVQKDKKIREAVCERFLDGCPVSQGVREWTKREAYGKYTGEGALDKYMSVPAFLKEYVIAEGYYMFACCKSGCFPDELIEI